MQIVGGCKYRLTKEKTQHILDYHGFVVKVVEVIKYYSHTRIYVKSGNRLMFYVKESDLIERVLR